MLQSIQHDAVAGTSTFEDYQEVVVNWSPLLYHCDNVALNYQIAKLDIYTPADMRAPGAPLGVFGIESAIDELAYALNADPLAASPEKPRGNRRERGQALHQPRTARRLPAGRGTFRLVEPPARTTLDASKAGN